MEEPIIILGQCKWTHFIGIPVYSPSYVATTDCKMLISVAFRWIPIVLCLIMGIIRGQSHKKENGKNCMSTYSFTVAESDHMRCSHQGAGKTPHKASGGDVDAVITRRLLAAVQKLVQHNNHLNEAKTAKDMVQELTDTMQHQEDEMKQLVHRMGQLQNQVQLHYVSKLFSIFHILAKVFRSLDSPIGSEFCYRVDILRSR